MILAIGMTLDSIMHTTLPMVDGIAGTVVFMVPLGTIHLVFPWALVGVAMHLTIPTIVLDSDSTILVMADLELAIQ